MLCIHLFQPKQNCSAPSTIGELIQKALWQLVFVGSWQLTLAQLPVTQKVNAVNTFGAQQNNVPIIWKSPCKLRCSLVAEKVKCLPRVFPWQTELVTVMKLSINDLQGEGCFGFALLVLLGAKKKKAAEESEQWAWTGLFTGGGGGLNPIQHKQYQCHHFFFLCIGLW